MIKIILVMLLSVNYILPQRNDRKTISPKTFDTLSSVHYLFNKREFSLDQKITQNDVGRVNDFLIDSKGNVIIADNFTIYKFDKKGDFIKKIKKSGRGPGEFVKIGAMAIDRNDNIYIEDSGAGKIVQYSNDFKLLKEIKKSDISSCQTMLIKENKALVCLLNTRGQDVINIYDINTGKLISKCGGNNKMQISMQPYQDGGGLVIDNSKIYYAHCLDPQIHVIDGGREYDLLKKPPSGFRVIDKNKKRIDPYNNSFSTVMDLKKYGDFLIIMYLKPVNNTSKIFSDIYTCNGELVGRNIPGFWLVQTKELAGDKYYRIFDERAGGYTANGLIVRIIEGK